MSSSGWVGVSGVAIRPVPPSVRPKPIVSLITPRWPPWPLRPPPDNNNNNGGNWLGVPFFPEWTKTTMSSDSGEETSSTESPEGNYESGDTAFVLFSMALVFLMIPGLGFFYSGLTRSKNALSQILFSIWCVAIVSIQWYIIGYSLTFSRNGSFFIGNFDHVFLRGVYDEPSPLNEGISSLVFCLYQGMFAAITCALALGAGAERNRFLPTTIFIILWTTFVYDFIAYWTWNLHGWSSNLGGLDFAGGTPVHIASGGAALAYSLVLGRRETSAEGFKPHNVSYVMLGTALLWFGWFGFNGGSALSPSIQAVNACYVTNLSASMGGIVWVILDYRHQRKYSPVAFCSGAIAGLVSITPACGYVSPASSLVFGAVGALACHLAVTLKPYLCYDDAVDVLEVHGVGAIVGNILTGVFAQEFYAPGIEGGGLDGHWIQVLHQLIDTVAGFVWSFSVSLIILLIINCIPGLKFRVPVEKERAGIDQSELGSNCYEFVEMKFQLAAENPNLNLHQQQVHNHNQFPAFWMKTGKKETKYDDCHGGPGSKFEYGIQNQIYPLKMEQQIIHF